MGTLSTKKKKLRSRAKRRRLTLKNLNYVPPVVNVDVEEIKKSFGSESKPEAEKTEEPSAEIESTEQVEDKE